MEELHEAEAPALLELVKPLIARALARRRLLVALKGGVGQRVQRLVAHPLVLAFLIRLPRPIGVV